MAITKVICGILVRDNKVFIAQRASEKTLPLKWEFPGGKMLERESEKACLAREWKEEFGVAILVNERFCSTHHKYEEIEILLTSYFISIKSGQFKLLEHKAIGWFTRDELINLDWAEADIPIMKEFIKNVWNDNK